MQAGHGDDREQDPGEGRSGAGSPGDRRGGTARRRGSWRGHAQGFLVRFKAGGVPGAAVLSGPAELCASSSPMTRDTRPPRRHPRPAAAPPLGASAVPCRRPARRPAEVDTLLADRRARARPRQARALALHRDRGRGAHRERARGSPWPPSCRPSDPAVSPERLARGSQRRLVLSGAPRRGGGVRGRRRTPRSPNGSRSSRRGRWR